VRRQLEFGCETHQGLRRGGGSRFWANVIIDAIRTDGRQRIDPQAV
jgi:hypothetical protein